jgi:hypothetical protein
MDLSDHPDQEESLNLVHTAHEANRYGVQQMYQLNLTHQRIVVDSYFNTMGIRHPLDRLVAYYRDKILGTDR